MNWNTPGDVFEGEPNGVHPDNGNNRLVVENTVKAVVWLLVKVNWKMPLLETVAPVMTGGVTRMDCVTEMVWLNRWMCAVRLVPVVLAVKAKLTTPLFVPVMVSQD